MRTFLILLVLVNLVYFGWTQGWLRDMPEQQAPVVADALPPFQQAERGLTLLDELPGDAGDVPVEGLAGVDALAGEQVGEEAGQAEQLDGQLDEQPGDQLADLAESGLDEQPEQAEPDLTGGPDTLVGPRWCAELGLFVEADPAEALVPELLLLGIDAELVGGRRQVGTTFWVHSPLFASESEALSLLAELQEKNIDSFYMRDGELAGRISLGVFRGGESAQRMQSIVTEQGYQAEISLVAREDDRFWLELQAPSAAVLETPDWRALATRLGLSGEAGEQASGDTPELTEKVCNPVASATQFP